MKEVAKDWRKLLSLLLIIALLMQVSPIQAFADRQDEAAVQGTVTAVKAGSNTLVTNSYAANNGLLTKQSYGNGFVVGHSYDSLDRESSRTYNSGNKFYWSYNADGNLARYTETGGRVLTYTYDDIGRLLQVSGNDGSYIKTAYDNVDKSTQLHYRFNGQRRDVYFNYSKADNLPLNVKFGANSAYSVENTYDVLTRLSSKSYAVTGSGTLKTTYKYHDWANPAERTTGTVEGIKYSYAADELKTHNRWYTYDKAGNILGEYEWLDSSKPVKERYTYDNKNQLIRHDSVTQGCAIEYSYDTAGNITKKNTYAYTLGELTGVTPTETVEYKYEDSTWHDLLTSYDGQAIEYDAIGNPTIYRGWTMSWQGRQLAGASKDGRSLSFTYDSDGIRTSKTVGNVKTSYLLNGTQILAQTTNGKTLCFFYDQQGSRVAMADSSNHIYYYLYNLQGDVIALADSATGQLVATYTYDAWGKIVKINNQNPETVAETSIAKVNPFRYRGYYYDSETGLYYLQSRYYDAETGRFINADGQLNEGVLGYNMFAYCENNPVNGSDPTGNWPKFFKSAFKKICDGFNRIKESIEQEVNSFFDNVQEYSEHKKRGSTNPSNRNKHEAGQARKNRDHGNEKGDVRRQDRSNKRRSIDLADKHTVTRVAGGVIAVTAGLGFLYLTLNDVTGVGVADDIAIPPILELYRRGVTMMIG